MSEPEGPKRIGDILGKVLARYGYADTTAQLELERVWHGAAGDQVHRHTRVGALRRGVLEILVDNSALLQELEGFRKQTLLEAMRGQLRHASIHGLRFRRM